MTAGQIKDLLKRLYMKVPGLEERVNSGGFKVSADSVPLSRFSSADWFVEDEIAIVPVVPCGKYGIDERFHRRDTKQIIRPSANSTMQSVLKDWYGRTHVVIAEKGRVRANKYLKQLEEEADLEREAIMMRDLNVEGIEVPVPIQASNGSYVFINEGSLSNAPPEAMFDPSHKYISYLTIVDAEPCALKTEPPCAVNAEPCATGGCPALITSAR
ncbi:MAG: hypothetical protein PHP46_02700, partial [Candidatus Omnitrophica bacterium]|nr:hypothetical protein [Candidatus Omnitrophota bacterium]